MYLLVYLKSEFKNRQPIFKKQVFVKFFLRKTKKAPQGELLFKISWFLATQMHLLAYQKCFYRAYLLWHPG